MCAMPRAPPPESASPMRGAAAGGLTDCAASVPCACAEDRKAMASRDATKYRIAYPDRFEFMCRPFSGAAAGMKDHAAAPAFDSTHCRREGRIGRWGRGERRLMTRRARQAIMTAIQGEQITYDQRVTGVDAAVRGGHRVGA